MRGVSSLFSSKRFVNFDYYLLLAVCALTIFGIICIGSATHINLGESANDFYMQIFYFVAGLIALFVIQFIDLEQCALFYKPLYFFNIAMLLTVLFAGTTVNGATRWLRIGPVSVQPSEFSKIIMIFLLAKIIEKYKEDINRPVTIGLILFITLVPVALIQAQPSLSASLVLLATFVTQLFAAEFSYKYIFKLLIIILPIFAICIFDILLEDPFFMDNILLEYQMNRIISLFYPELDPNNYYQTLKSLQAIGSGQMHGKGLYGGTFSQLSYLPESHNDFIFSVIGEEFGFVGCLSVVILMLFIILRCILIAIETKNVFHQLIIAGVVGMLAFQAFMNIGVSTGLVPNTGMPLPFISAGGSSLLVNFISVGLILNIGCKRSKSLFD